MLTLFVYAPNERLFDETVDFYSLLGFKVVSKFDRSANLHLFSSESQFSLTIHLNTELDVATTEKKVAHTAEILSKKNIDHVVNERDFSFGIFEFSVRRFISPPFNLILKTYLEQLKQKNTYIFQHLTMYFLADPVGNLISIQDHPVPAAPVKSDSTVDGFMAPQKVSGSEVKINLLKSERELESTCSLLAEPKRKIGVLTSGGDSSGMNAAVRAITRYALQRGCQPYAIFEGYNGLVEGGDKIKSLGWEDVRGLLSMVIFSEHFL